MADQQPGLKFDVLLDGAILSWRVRDGGTRAPNVRLVNLSRQDERLDAHLDAVMVWGERCRQQVLATYDSGDEMALFPLACLGITYSSSDDTVLISKLLENCRAVAPVDAAIDATTSGLRSNLLASKLTAALSWVDRRHALSVINHIIRDETPILRCVAIAALGNRRLEMDRQLLTQFNADPSPLVRARAYRTTGQLGRQDLMAHLRPGLTDADPECRFWSAWAAARMGAGEEALGVLAEIAWTNQPRAVRALDLLLRRLELPHANTWLREFAKLPGRQRDLIRATGVIGDPVYIPWLIERMAEPETARLAGEAFSMITGLDLAYRDLDRKPPRDFESGPNDDPADENVALDEDDNLPWPDPGRVGAWWLANLNRYTTGAAYFLGTPKPATDWLAALSDAFQRQRHAAALELAIRMPQAAMFEVRARGRLQRRLIARSRGLA